MSADQFKTMNEKVILSLLNAIVYLFFALGWFTLVLGFRNADYYLAALGGILILSCPVLAGFRYIVEAAIKYINKQNDSQDKN